jgi:hypothetical protein
MILFRRFELVFLIFSSIVHVFMPIALIKSDTQNIRLIQPLDTRLPRLIRVEASNTAGRVHQLQAFFLFLRGRHYTFVYLAA